MEQDDEQLADRVFSMHCNGYAVSAIAWRLKIGADKVRGIITAKWYEDKQAAALERWMRKQGKMEVHVLKATESPLEAISLAAGTCYGKFDFSVKRVRNCFKAGHLSVFEHASATFRIEGISRACMAQLTRHRLCSFCVESQRYCKYDLKGRDWYVTPLDMMDSEGKPFSDFAKHMGACAEAYNEAVSYGVKPEDARYMLPEATKTNLVITANLRELFHIWDMRGSQAAQWEIRDLAGKMIEALAAQGWEWEYLTSLYVYGENAEPPIA